MSTLTIICLLTAAVMHASWNIIMISGPDKFLESTIRVNFVSLICLAAIPFFPWPDPACWPYLGATLICQACYNLLLSRAYSEADFLSAYPAIRGAAPLWTLLVSVSLLGEELSGRQIVGCLLVVLAIAILARPKPGGAPKSRAGRKALVFALLCSGAVTGYTVMDGNGVRLTANPGSYICWAFFLNSLLISSLALLKRGRRQYLSYLRGRWPWGLASAVLGLAAYSLPVWFMVGNPIPLVAALRETSIIFGAILAVIFLKEKLSPATLIALVTVFAGVICMRA